MVGYQVSTCIARTCSRVRKTKLDVGQSVSSAMGSKPARWAKRAIIALAVLAVFLVAISPIFAHADIKFSTRMDDATGSYVVGGTFTFPDGSKLNVDSNGALESTTGGAAAQLVSSHSGVTSWTVSTVKQLSGDTVTAYDVSAGTNIGNDALQNADSQASANGGASIIDQIFTPLSNEIWNAAGSILGGLCSSSLLTRPFEAMFGEGSWIYAAIEMLNRTVCQPTAYSILAILLLVQIFNIAKKTSSGDMLPGIRELVILFVFFAVFSWMIANAMPLCKAIYEACVDMIIQVQSVATGSSSVSIPDVSEAGNFIKFLVGILLWFAGVVAYVATTAMLLMRSFQIYVLAMFSPIAFSLLGAELTRPMGVGFIKNFVAACLAGVIIMLLIMLYPALFAGIAGNAISLGDGMMGAIALLAIPTLMTAGMVKSGAWAKEILGS